MTDLIIIGAGETAEMAYHYFAAFSDYTIAGFAVPAAFRQCASLKGLEVYDLEALPRFHPPRTCRVFVAVSFINMNRLRRSLLNSALGMGYESVSFIHPTVLIGPGVTIGHNVFIQELNNIQYNVTIRDNVTLWAGNHIGHGTTIEQDAFISSHCVVSGFCTVGRGAFLGVNTSIRDGVSIGEECLIGAAANVVKDTAPGRVYIGNPAKDAGPAIKEA